MQLLQEVLQGTTKSNIQILLLDVLSLNKVPVGSKAKLIDQVVAVATDSPVSHKRLCESLLRSKPYTYISFLVRTSGGCTVRSKAAAIAEFMRLDQPSAHRSAATPGDVNTHALVLLEHAAVRTKRSNKLKKKLWKHWGKLVRRHKRKLRSKAIIDEIAWCVRCTQLPVGAIKRHVASKVKMSLEIGHACVFFHKQLQKELARRGPKGKQIRKPKKVAGTKPCVIERGADVMDECRAMFQEDKWYSKHRRLF